MRYLERLPKPQILIDKEVVWTDSFVNSDKKSPDSSKYRHVQILDSLNSTSFYKCFYSEQKLKGVPNEIDHHIEVSDISGRHLAYDWDNLYLSSVECNNKFPNSVISVKDVLNPFLYSDFEIEKHLYFENNQITSNTDLGLQTIKKFRLDAPLIDYLRGKQLDKFKDLFIEILKNQNKEGREINEAERKALHHFCQPDQSFSLMFRLLLKKHNL